MCWWGRRFLESGDEGDHGNQQSRDDGESRGRAGCWWCSWLSIGRSGRHRNESTNSIDWISNSGCNNAVGRIVVCKRRRDSKNEVASVINASTHNGWGFRTNSNCVTNVKASEVVDRNISSWSSLLASKDSLTSISGDNNWIKLGASRKIGLDNIDHISNNNESFGNTIGLVVDIVGSQDIAANSSYEVDWSATSKNIEDNSLNNCRELSTLKGDSTCSKDIENIVGWKLQLSKFHQFEPVISAPLMLTQ